LGASAQEQDDAVAWLESLAAKHGAKPEELVTDPNKRSEKPPEWVSQAQSIGEAQAAQPEPKSEVVENALNIGEQFFAEFESASAAPSVTDETSAWLQNLAEEEEKEEKRVEAFGPTDEIPDWLSESQPEKLPSAEIPEWLSDTQPEQETGGQFEFAQQETESQKSDLPNWLSDIEKDVIPQRKVDEDLPESNLANWLNSLDDEPGLPFESLPTPDSILFESQSKPAPTLKGKETKSDLPDWLSDVDSTGGEITDEEWKAPVEKQAEDLPEWLQETDEEVESTYGDDDTPPWQHRERWEAEEPQYPQPTSPSDWHPLEPRKVEVKPTPAPRQEAPVEAHKPFVPPPPQPTQPVSAPIPQSAAPAKKKAGLPARKQPEGANAVIALNQAKTELDRGDIPAALAHYGKLIKKGKHIEETIRDLTESIYRYPVEVGIWQTLGDAYMRANRLKEALEAYNKAEELIR
jgi:tetratricopeptide (TPR) repeat protein